MHDSSAEREVEVLVVGAGQAGLSVGYHLRRAGLAAHTDYVLLDADEQLTAVETYLLEALERLDAAESRALQLEAALAHSRDIGAAIGILMALRRVTREQAFDELRRASMARNVKLHVLALEVVETGRIDQS